jgi:Ser/Thr protein kinase RdoA (MazF antagonist)
MKLAEFIAQNYNLNVKSISSPSSGYRNNCYKLTTDKGDFNLIVYKREPGILAKIKAANEFSSHLSGLPVRTAISASNGRAIIRLAADSYACLYNFLPGDTISWEAYTAKHLKLLGENLGKLHNAKVEVGPGFPDAVTELESQLQRMQEYFARAGVQRACADKLGLQLERNFLYYFDVALKVLRKLPTQPLHLDFVRGNLLWKSQPELQLSGIIDFEKAGLGPAVLDVARTLAFLLVDCKFKTEEQIKRAFLNSGYQKRGKGKLSALELKLLQPLVAYFLCYDFYKFLLHNPYEFLADNEHFVRTRQKLVQLGISYQKL